MDNFKVIYSIPFLFFIIVSCSNSSTEMVAKSKYDAKIAEYKELNEQQAAVIEDNLEKSKIINNVVTELNQIAGNTHSLRVKCRAWSGGIESSRRDQSETSDSEKALKCS